MRNYLSSILLFDRTSTAKMALDPLTGVFIVIKMDWLHCCYSGDSNGKCEILLLSM